MNSSVEVSELITTNLTLSVGFLCFIFITHCIWAMKKGSKRIDNTYTAEITDLAFNPSFKTSSNSLRELVKLIQTHVPNMDTHSKVYREMRVNVGVYMSLFTHALPNKKIRQVVVQITSKNITDKDIDRFYAHAATLPQYTPDVTK